MTQYVFIVDDDPAVRDAISLWLSCHHYQTLCFEDAIQFTQQFTTDLNGCIIADIRMPGMDGLELQAHLNNIGCQLPLIFITGHGTVPMAVEAMRNGALDYLRKPVNEQQLLHKVAEAFTTDQANNQQQQLALAHQNQLNSLTNREQQVAALVVEGLANKVIASDLGISERTVEVHRASVMTKLEVKTLAQLVKRYLNIT
jgi:two-component system response regulator FixJ